MVEIVPPLQYIEFLSIIQPYWDVFISIYTLKTENEEELTLIYKNLKKQLLDSKICTPTEIVYKLLFNIKYKNRYLESYLKLIKMIDEEFQTKYSQIKNVYFQEFKKVEDEKLLEKFKNYSSEFQTPVLKAVMHNDEKAFISIAEGEDFDEKQTFQSCFFPNRDYSYSLLELCCYYGAVDCFKQLQTKFELKFSKICLMLSFLGGNPEIMSECLKYQIPTEECMEYAIFSHNIDFVTFLFNEYNIKINADYCCKYDNLLALFVYLDQTKALDECLKFSININIQDFCDYLIKYGANVNSGVLHDAVKLNNLKLIRFLISKGAHVNEIVYEKTPLIIACEYNYMETLSTLIQLGADPEIETSYGKTVLYRAIELDHNEIVDFLISKNINYCKKAFLMQLKETTPRSLKFSFLAGHT